MKEQTTVEFQQDVHTEEIAMTPDELLKEQNWAVCSFYKGEFSFVNDLYCCKKNAQKRLGELQRIVGDLQRIGDYRLVRILH